MPARLHPHVDESRKNNSQFYFCYEVSRLCFRACTLITFWGFAFVLTLSSRVETQTRFGSKLARELLWSFTALNRQLLESNWSGGVKFTESGFFRCQHASEARLISSSGAKNISIRLKRDLMENFLRLRISDERFERKLKWKKLKKKKKSLNWDFGTETKNFFF